MFFVCFQKQLLQGSQALGVPPDDHTCIHKRIQGDPHPWCYRCIAKYGKNICQRDNTCDLCRNIDSTIWSNILKSSWKMERQSPSISRPLTELEADSALGSTGIGFPLTPVLDSDSDSEGMPIPMTQRYIDSPQITDTRERMCTVETIYSESEANPGEEAEFLPPR